MSLRDAVASAIAGREVPAELLEGAFAEIISGEASDILTTALLVALHTKGETVGEIVAAARALRARAVTATCTNLTAAERERRDHAISQLTAPDLSQRPPSRSHRRAPPRPTLRSFGA